MIEESGSRAGSGSIPLISGSGSGFGRPKNSWIRWIGSGSGTLKKTLRVAIARKAAEVAEEEEEGEVAELSSMFTVGQPLIVAVVSCLQVYQCCGSASL
jgi:hypothetical protein